MAGGLVVRALLIGAIGHALGMLGQLNDVEGILPFYAVLFLLAVPLLGCPPLVLAGVAAGVIVAGPVLLVATAQAMPYAGSDLDRRPPAIWCGAREDARGDLIRARHRLSKLLLRQNLVRGVAALRFDRIRMMPCGPLIISHPDVGAL